MPMKILKGFQFHLSTALVCMIVAGGLMAVNFKTRAHYTAPLYATFGDPVPFLIGDECGWPFVFRTRCTGKWREFKQYVGESVEPVWETTNLTYDVGIAALIILSTAIALESFIHYRRTKNQKPETLKP